MPMLYFRMQDAYIGDMVQVDILNADQIPYVPGFLSLRFAKVQYHIWSDPLSASATNWSVGVKIHS